MYRKKHPLNPLRSVDVNSPFRPVIPRLAAAAVAATEKVTTTAPNAVIARKSAQSHRFTSNDSENISPPNNSRKHGMSENDAEIVASDDDGENGNVYQTQRPIPEIDPIIEVEDAEAEAAEENPREARHHRENFYTQTQNLINRDYLGGGIADEFDDGPFFRRLKKLGVEVMRSDENEVYFYLGEKTHAELIKLIESEWSSNSGLVNKIIQEFKEALGKTCNSWMLFLSPTKNINGIQDTIIRALILTSAFQTETFNIIYRRLDDIAKNHSNGDQQIQIGDKIILQLRYITEIFNPLAISTIVFDKKIEHWNSELREKLIEIIPELFTDISVHSSIAKHLLDFILIRGLEELNSLHASCFKALKCLDVDEKMNKKIQITIMKNLMNFELENLPLAMETSLSVLDKNKNGSFKSFLICLHMFLDIAKLRRIDAENESTVALEETISKIFFCITEFMRFNLNQSQKDLTAFFGIQKITRASAFGSKKGFVDDDENDDNEIEEEEESFEQQPDDEEYEGDAANFIIFRRDFDLIDILLLICFNEASNDTSFILKELRKQVSVSHDTFLSIKHLFGEAVNFPMFSKTYLSSILNLSRDLLQSPNPRLNEIGGVIYKQLFLCRQLPRSIVLESIASHFSEMDSETTTALTILEEVAEIRIETLRDFLGDLNALLDNLAILSTENIRRLFFVLISLNLYSDISVGQTTQYHRQTEGTRFLRRLNHYLISSIYREIVWGIVGLIQYVKVLLLSSNINGGGGNGRNDAEILDTLQKVDKVTKKHGGKIRAEFYIQLSELLKSMKKLGGESPALATFGEELTESVRFQFYLERDSQISQRSSNTSLGQFDAEDFIDPQSATWINLAELVFADDDKLTGLICGLLPLLQLVKDFACYRDSFTEDYDSDPLKTDFWNNFLFILESNVNLTSLTQSPDLTQHDQLRRSNVLYVTVEYLRTILNMFADCRIESPKIQQWMEKKLNLMIYCQNQLKNGIKKIGSYHLPMITRINKCELIVKDKDSKRSKKSSKNNDGQVAEEEQLMVVDQHTFGINENNENGERPQNFNEAYIPEPLDETGEEFTFGSFKLRNGTLPKNISIEQLQWYCTPLRLETVTKLIQATGMKRKQTLSLVETLHVILKYTMPTRGGKQTPIGFGLGTGAPLPIATMDFGSKDDRWKLVSAAIPALFEILSKAVENFTTNTIQTPHPGSPDYVNEMANLLKFCVMIFSRIFQSHEIASECDHHDSDRTRNLQSRRGEVIFALNRAIGIFNSSKLPQNESTRNGTVNSVNRSRNSIMPPISIPNGRVSDVVDANNSEEGVIEFFIEVAYHVPTTESAAAMLALLKTFTNLNEFHRRKCATIALYYLSKKWSDDEAADQAHDDKNAYVIANDFIYFRPESQKISAVCWLIWHQFLSIFPKEFLVEQDLKLGNFTDSEDYVNEHSESVFPCFTKKSFLNWHKLLFKQFNDNVLRYLRNDNKSIVIDSRKFITDWIKIAQTFNILTCVIKNKDFRLVSVLINMAKEGRRFISFIMSKPSSFAAIVKDEQIMVKYKDDIYGIVKFIQLGNRLLGMLRNLAQKRKNALLLTKLCPELKAANEKMMRDFKVLATAAGFGDAVSFGHLKNRNLDATASNRKSKTNGNKRSCGKDLNATENTPVRKKRSRKSKTPSTVAINDSDNTADENISNTETILIATIKQERFNENDDDATVSGYVGGDDDSSMMS